MHSCLLNENQDDLLYYLSLYESESPLALPGGVDMWVVLFVCHLIRDRMISMEKETFEGIQFHSGISCEV